MCFKTCKKCCKTILFAALVGGVVYYLKSKNSDGKEMGCVIADNLRGKKDKFVNACDCVKDETKDMASEVKQAAQSSAGEVKTGLKNMGESVKSGWENAGDSAMSAADHIRGDIRQAADHIRNDMGEIKHTANEMFENGDRA